MHDPLIEDMIRHGNQKIPEQHAPITLSESISFVQQTPWIQNKSIRENILFGEEYDQSKYDEVIKIC